jgi:hypothetical protein
MMVPAIRRLRRQGLDKRRCRGREKDKLTQNAPEGMVLVMKTGTVKKNAGEC